MCFHTMNNPKFFCENGIGIYTKGRFRQYGPVKILKNLKLGISVMHCRLNNSQAKSDQWCFARAMSWQQANNIFFFVARTVCWQEASKIVAALLSLFRAWTLTYLTQLYKIELNSSTFTLFPSSHFVHRIVNYIKT